jgi:hypothetical protein
MTPEGPRSYNEYHTRTITCGSNNNHYHGATYVVSVTDPRNDAEVERLYDEDGNVLKQGKIVTEDNNARPKFDEDGNVIIEEDAGPDHLYDYLDQNPPGVLP